MDALSRKEQGERLSEWIKFAEEARRFGSTNPDEVADVLTFGVRRQETACDS